MSTIIVKKRRREKKKKKKWGGVLGCAVWDLSKGEVLVVGGASAQDHRAGKALGAVGGGA